MDKKQFALSKIARYFKDPSKCGFEDGHCLYLTSDGKNCIAGESMLDPSRWSHFDFISSILMRHEQEDVFKPDSVNILCIKEWRELQSVHDAIANNFSRKDGVSNTEYIRLHVKELGLFTYEELEQAANNL